MTDDNKPLIELQNISRVYRTKELETHALAGVDLHIHKGELGADPFGRRG